MEVMDRINDHEERIRKLEESDSKMNERFAKLETQMKYMNENVISTKNNTEILIKEKNQDYKKWIWIIISVVTTSAVTSLIQAL